jgi:hypothetical protein
MNELKRLDFSKDTFVANGVTYHIEKGMSTVRFCEYQILEKEAAFGMDFMKMFTLLGEIRSAYNECRFVDGSVKLDNLQRGVAQIHTRTPSVLKMCALFINTVDEDRKVITDEVINKKIEDWNEYDVRDFFTLALNGVSGFIDVYTNFSRIISAQDTTKLKSKEGANQNLNEKK